MDKDIIREFIEKGADLEHDRWSRWQKYIMLVCFREIETSGKNMVLEMPKKQWDNWHRQIMTLYADLSEREKESDRKETRNYLPLLEEALKDQREDILNEIVKWLEELKLEKEVFYAKPSVQKNISRLENKITNLIKSDI